jgi:hypothetical protein
VKSINFGFYGEGIRDYGFTFPIAQRTVQEILLPHIDVQSHPIEIKKTGLRQEEIIQAVARRAHGMWFVVFHLDADSSDDEEALRERFQPGLTSLQSYQDCNKHIVPVIPVRMTEAWMLADFQSFLDVVGTHLPASELGFPHSDRGRFLT